MEISLKEPTADRTPANMSLLITTVAYLLLNGAQLFETAVLVPVWTVAPPASLHLFQGPYGLDFKVFWIVAHSLHELTFLAALVLNWNIHSRRKILLVVLVLHVLVRAWTLLYFAPVIISFQQIPVSDTVDQILLQKAARWREMNLVRVAAFTILSFVLIPLNRTGKITDSAISHA
ncbi:MAG: transposase [Dyadobacter sp.]|uniref:transposase n=1 Tax=Dyadobacter sp. TaxID=1914288 RepID=UPI001B001487|nr:transposase [Dyadobacter sp.]MBO9611194.1 transposase [Dyadobacter sp.]